MNALARSAMLLTMLAALPACEKMTGAATATERELCLAWRDSLPSRSDLDTQQTREEIGLSYDVQAAACPAFARF